MKESDKQEIRLWIETWKKAGGSFGRNQAA